MADRAPEDTALSAPQEAGYPISLKRLPDGRWLAAALDLAIRRDGATADEAVAAVRAAVRALLAEAHKRRRKPAKPGSCGELALWRQFAEAEGTRFEKTENPAYAFATLAYALAAHPEFQLHPLVRQYFIEAAEKLKLMPAQIRAAALKEITKDIASRLGFTRPGRNAIAAMKRDDGAEDLELEIEISMLRTGKTKTATINERSEATGHDARVSWRRLSRRKPYY